MGKAEPLGHSCNTQSVLLFCRSVDQYLQLDNVDLLCLPIGLQPTQRAESLLVLHIAFSWC